MPADRPRGGRWAGDRRVINGAFFSARAGCPWWDLPEGRGRPVDFPLGGGFPLGGLTGQQPIRRPRTSPTRRTPPLLGGGGVYAPIRHRNSLQTRVTRRPVVQGIFCRSCV